MAMVMNETKLFTPPELGYEPLPVAPYVSAELFEQDRDAIFRRAWLNVGRVEEIPNPGSYFVKDLPVCRTSLFVSRGKDGEVRAFHNICSHRGNKLVWNQRGEGMQHACKFHGWNYASDGKLIGVPEEDRFFKLDRAKRCLKAVATDVWQGFIFVCLSPAPERTLLEFLGEVPGMLDGYEFGRFTACYSYDLDLDCGWRILRDSQLEGYHAKYLHRRSLPGLMVNWEEPSKHLLAAKTLGDHAMLSLFGNPDREPTEIQKVAFQWGSAVSGQALNAESVEAVACLNPTRSESWLFDLYFVFPNLHLIPMADMCIVHNMWPIDHNHSVWEARVYLPEAANCAEWFSREYAKCAIRDTWLEDGSTLENTQLGHESGVITEQLLQDQEFVIRHAEAACARYEAVV